MKRLVTSEDKLLLDVQSIIINNGLEQAFIKYIINNYKPEDNVIEKVLEWKDYKGKQIINLLIDYFSIEDIKEIKYTVLSNYRKRIDDLYIQNAFSTLKNYNGDFSDIEKTWELLLTHLIFVNNKLKPYFSNTKKITKLEGCLSINDKVNDVIFINHLDINDRERVFVFLDNKIIWGERNQSHGDLLELGYYRPEIKQIIDKQGNVSVGFGHYSKGIVAINANSNDLHNCSIKDILSKLVSQSKFPIKKVYALFVNKLLRIY